MKKIVVVLFAIMSVVALSACTNDKKLVLYNWGEYLNPDLKRAFEAETGIYVEEIFFTSNEAAIVRMQQGEQFDLVIPSEYAIENLAELNLIQEIDWDLITEISKDDIADGLKDLLNRLNDVEDGFDFLNYSVPYFWGNFGLLYNTTTVNEEDLALNWDILYKDGYKISLYDNSRDGLLPGLKQNGISLNTTLQSEVDTAKEWTLNLKHLKGNQISFISDQVLERMLPPGFEQFDISCVFNGDAVFLMGENDNLDYYTPDNGTNIFADGFVIPKNANNEYAYEFINFMSRYENALENTLYIGYTSPRQDVLDFVLSSDEYFLSLENAYNVVFREEDEIYRYNQVNKSMLEQAWLAILSS